MESPYAISSSQSPASFFYYTPDPQARPRHHGHFLPHPQANNSGNQLLTPSPVSQMSYPSQLVYGGLENTQSTRSLAPILSITPAASPSLQKSNMVKNNTEFLYQPTTPPLSYSAVSTPALTSTMLTPMSNHGWSTEEHGCGTITPSEMQMPGTPSEWQPQSPEMPYDGFTFQMNNGTIAPSETQLPGTPAEWAPQSPNISSFMFPSILVNDSYCPALSPSSSQTSSSPDLDFCDPRNLTFNGEDAQDYEFSLDFPSASFSSELESKTRLSQPKFNKFPTGYDMSFGWNEEDLEECKPSDSFESQQTSPCESTTESFHSAYDRRDSKRSKIDDSDSETELTEAERLKNFKFGSRDDGSVRPQSCSAASKSNVIRRGRKQSLTEDPSKTFVCHLCNRRFRRQEHLKRHFRSLHTEDKPFSCGECGKKFSRSDNLTQHSRIHGAGNILLELCEDAFDCGKVYDPITAFNKAPLGIVVVDPAQSLSPISPMDKSSEEKRNRRKRTRNEE